APPREAPGSPTGLPPPTAHDQTSPAMDACRVQRPHHHSVTMNYFAAHMQRHWPGTSKWNKIEHRLFSAITMNWRGRPLTSHEVIVNTIAATTTRTGLAVHAELDPGAYPAGVTISQAELDALPLARHDWHGDWNYTLHPPPATISRHIGDIRRLLAQTGNAIQPATGKLATLDDLYRYAAGHGIPAPGQDQLSVLIIDTY